MLYQLSTAVLLVLLTGVESLALDRDLTLQQFEHRSWNTYDVAPDTAVALAHTGEGRLWLATATGPVSFDGFAFGLGPWFHDAPWTIPSAALATSDGALWIGSQFGGVQRLESDKTVTAFDIDDGLPAGTVNALVEDRRGVVWAATATGLARLSNRRWQRMYLWEFNNAGVYGAFVARDDTLWIATRDCVVVSAGCDRGRWRLGGCQWRPGAAALRRRSIVATDCSSTTHRRRARTRRKHLVRRAARRRQNRGNEFQCDPTARERSGQRRAGDGA